MALHHMLRAAAQQQAAGPSDPYFYDVSLLLTGNGTNGAQNNTFLDSSTNNFTITRNGNATQGTFSPYGSLWSNYFDGNGDYLNTSSNTWTQLSTGNFTVEAWCNITSYGTYFAVFEARTASGLTPWIFGVNGSGYADFFYGTTSGDRLTDNVAVGLNTWVHIAAVRNGSTITLYVNGVSKASASYSSAINGGTSTPKIGTLNDPVYANGYISNARVVIGTAVYTSAFTPSTTPLTAVSGTALLTCQSNRFIDNSSNNFAITVNGDTKAQRFSPFNPTAPYSASTIGGSGYFDGSGDKITAPSSTAFNFGTGDFTIEMWAYANATIPTYSNAFFLMDARTSASWYIFLASNALYFGDSAGTEHNGGSLRPFAWNHLVVSRVSGTTKGFVNGVQAFSFSDSGNYTGSPVVTIGGRYTLTAADLNGYMSDVRIVKGSGVSSVTVPTAPLTAITNTQLLCSFTNAGIPDAAMINDLETVGNAQVSTSVKKYGTGSLAFDGTGDWLQTSNVLGWSFGSGNFTVECWFNSTSTNQYASLVSADGSGSAGWAFLLNPTANDGKITFYEQNLAGSLLTTSTGGYNDGSWHHVALVRNGTSLVIYVDGTSRASSTTSATASVPGLLYVGNSVVSGRALTGYMDDFRITKGYARYTANFTPPTAALPVY